MRKLRRAARQRNKQNKPARPPRPPAVASKPKRAPDRWGRSREPALGYDAQFTAQDAARYVGLHAGISETLIADALRSRGWVPGKRRVNLGTSAATLVMFVPVWRMPKGTRVRR